MRVRVNMLERKSDRHGCMRYWTCPVCMCVRVYACVCVCMCAFRFQISNTMKTRLAVGRARSYKSPQAAYACLLKKKPMAWMVGTAWMESYMDTHSLRFLKPQPRPLTEHMPARTCKRMGLMPSKRRRSNRDWLSPASAAFLHMITGPSWQWSPTSTTWCVCVCVCARAHVCV